MGLSIAYGSVGTDEERLKVVSSFPSCIPAVDPRPPPSQVLDAVYESGCTFWDTADTYGDNEELIAKWYAHRSRALSPLSS